MSTTRSSTMETDMCCFHLDYFDIMHSLYLVAGVNDEDYISMMMLYLDAESETYIYDQVLNLPVFIVYCKKCPLEFKIFMKVRMLIALFFKPDFLKSLTLLNQILFFSDQRT